MIQFSIVDRELFVDESKVFKKFTEEEYCWIWTARVDSTSSRPIFRTHLPGYITDIHPGRILYAIKYSLKELPKLFLYNVCRDRRCVNPDHLELMRPNHLIETCSHSDCTVPWEHDHRSDRLPSCKMTDRDKFWSKVERTETCWVWGGKPCGGYGQFTLGAHGLSSGKGRTVQAHNYSYSIIHGLPLEDWQVLDHTCLNKMCVRPDHLSPVTVHTNSGRGGSHRAVKAKLSYEDYLTRADIFWARVRIGSPEECWIWSDRAKSPYGYFSILFKGEWRSVGAHVMAYVLTHGNQKEGYVVDHTCRNKKCVNPSHLESVTIRENSRRGRARR